MAKRILGVMLGLAGLAGLAAGCCEQQHLGVLEGEIVGLEVKEANRVEDASTHMAIKARGGEIVVVTFNGCCDSDSSWKVGQLFYKVGDTVKVSTMECSCGSYNPYGKITWDDVTRK